MIVTFKNQGTEDTFYGKNTKNARKACPTLLWRKARIKLDQLDSASDYIDIKVPPGNRLKSLKGARLGQSSIRINDQYRICFVWSESGPMNVEITDYH